MTRDLGIQTGWRSLLCAAGSRSLAAPLLGAQLSRKLKIVSFLSILIILFNHATNFEILYGSHRLVTDHTLSEFLQRLVRDGLGRVNRSMFFFIAGFLFFWNLEPGFASFAKKFRTRVSSLLVPYLLCSLAGLLVWLVVGTMPGTQHFLGRHAGVNCSPAKLLHVLLLDPVPYQLWFIRDLMFWVLLSPVIHLVVSRLGWYSLAAVFGFWFSDATLPSFGLSAGSVLIFEKTGFCFFCAGAVLGHKRWDLERFASPHGTMWLCTWVISAAAYVFMARHGDFDFKLLQQFSMLAGMMALWVNYDRLPASVLEKIAPWSCYTFFIYLFHEPLLTATKKLVCYVVPMSPLTSLLNFLLIPPLIAAACIVAGGFLKNHFQRTYRLLTGGR